MLESDKDIVAMMKHQSAREKEKRSCGRLTLSVLGTADLVGLGTRDSLAPGPFKCHRSARQGALVARLASNWRTRGVQ